MKLNNLRQLLGRPAFHGLLAAVFGGIFMWPFFVFSKPAATWAWLHLGWILCAVVMFAVSRGEDARDDEEEDEAPSAHAHAEARVHAPGTPANDNEAR